ncbi:helix-turn-helix transcriptional regulator [Actinocrispum wychmicini]|nr:YafY family protein [Actinocrispum wychmicini]
MNRTDRLYAIVEDLRAVAPRPRSARQLAGDYEVSVRTIERDISALQQAGVPIYANTGRRGGYALDPAMTLPPLNFTPEEAVAVSVALQHAAGSPFAHAARTALRKIVAAMPAREASAAHELASRVRFMTPVGTSRPAAIPGIIQKAVADRRVLRLDYLDRYDQPTERVVEPVMFVASPNGWYLTGWCRLRDSLRTFRLDRIVTVEETGEQAPVRPPGPVPAEIAGFEVQVAALA